jgi:hypothetical protein
MADPRDDLTLARMKRADSYASWPTFAGHLCATHIGSAVEIDGQRYVLRAIRHTEDHPGVWVLVRGADRQQHQLTLAPDAVISRVTSLHKPPPPVLLRS